MKQILLLVTLLLIAGGCSTIQRLDSTAYEVIPVPGGIREASTLTNVMQRVDHGEPVILKMIGGEEMPFKLSMDLPIGTLDKCESTFAFKQDTWFLISQRKCMLSPDGQRWANITSRSSLAKLFGIKHGQFSLGFSSRTNQSPFMQAEIKLK